jgi:Zn-dependent protease
VRKKVWVNILLFILTVLSTFFVGLAWGANYVFADKLPAGTGPDPAVSLFNPKVLWLGAVYSLVLMLILAGHELGHFLACRRYGIDASLPYFIPFPSLIGTSGAFIKIRSPIMSKRHLFDIGIAGPLVSFALSIPAVLGGLALSRAVSGLPGEEAILFGEPLILKAAAGLFFKHLSQGVDIILHPVAFAGWVGLLVSSFNLFPVGQLDGGHIAYAVLGSRSRKLHLVVVPALIMMGVFLWLGWLVWALVIIIFGLKHPRVLDEDASLGRGRQLLGALAVLIFILSFIPAPVKGYDLFSLLLQLGMGVK